MKSKNKIIEAVYTIGLENLPDTREECYKEGIKDSVEIFEIAHDCMAVNAIQEALRINSDNISEDIIDSVMTEFLKRLNTEP